MHGLQYGGRLPDLPRSAGNFNQALFHGSAALLNAANPNVGFGASVATIQAKMQQAFAGTISFAEAFAFFVDLNIKNGECDGGCFGSIKTGPGCD